jgi:molybdopterin converting factor small subunit
MSQAGGATEFEVEAATIQEMLNRLADEYPALRPILERSVTVVVDGHVYRGAWLQPLKEGSEIYLLPPLQGG